MAQKGSDLCTTLYTITAPQTSEQSTTANMLRGSLRACEGPQNPKNSQSCSELMVLPFSLVYARRNQEPLNETHEESFANTGGTELQTSAGRSFV